MDSDSRDHITSNIVTQLQDCAAVTLADGPRATFLMAAREIEVLLTQRDLWRAAAEAFERGSLSLGDRLCDEARRG